MEGMEPIAINIGISMSISISISKDVLCYNQSSKHAFVNAPCVYKQTGGEHCKQKHQGKFAISKIGYTNAAPTADICFSYSIIADEML